MMFMPTVSADSHYWFLHNQGELLGGREMLTNWSAETGKDWRKAEELPYDEAQGPERHALDKAENPREKTGLIGAFCRVFDVYRAIDELIPEVYDEANGSGNSSRYTFAAGSGYRGAVVYDDGLFMYSHHSTDPAYDKLCNAWDLVRIHKYGELDEGIADDTPPGQWPSQKAMEHEFGDHPEVAEEFQNTYSNGFEDLDAAKASESDEKPATSDEGESEHAGNSADPLTSSEWLDYMNHKHAVADVDGKIVILHFRKTEKGLRATYGTREGLSILYANRPVPENPSQTRAQWWLKHPKRKTFEGGVVFSPGRPAPPDTFNLWAGFSEASNPNGSSGLFLKHLLEIICCGNHAHYEWLLDYFAHMVQKPWEKPGVAVVLIGDKGTGKDTVGQYIGHMFRQNHVVVSQMDHVTGKFNAHLAAALLLHVEEAYWAGDKKATSALKALITSPTSMVEPKGVNPFVVDSYCRVLMTSNNDLVVNATFKERRFAVFKVSDARARDTAYFSAIYKEMRNGGAGALLDLLMKRDISGFDPRTPPITAGLTEQKLENLTNVDLWWFEVLFSGELPFDVIDGRQPGPWHDKGEILRRGSLYAAYKLWLESRPPWDRTPKSPSGKKLSFWSWL